jgi:putative redox protein
MDAKVTWGGRMSFTGTADTEFEVPLGASPEVGGDNDGFRPMELIAVGLAGCTAMDVISILSKKRQDVTHFEVQVHAKQASEHPRVFTNIHLEFIVKGRNVDPRAVERAIDLSANKYCPAQAMLTKAVTIEQSYTLQEAGVD